jgi:hypothetical protein
MLRIAFTALALLIAASAFAQEPVGCDKFKWPVDKERAMLGAAAAAPSGAEIVAPLAGAYKITLAPTDAANLPNAPTRAPRAGTNAGFVKAAALPKAGTYRVTLSEPGWIDVFQDGHVVKSGAFSGVTGCDGIRKSVKFELGASPFVIELSGVPANTISFVVTPD